MSASFGILRVAPFAGFVQRFDDLIGSATTMSLYFIHSRRWRENHDAAIKAFVARASNESLDRGVMILTPAARMDEVEGHRGRGPDEVVEPLNESGEGGDAQDPERRAHFRRFDPSNECLTTLSGTWSPCRTVNTAFRRNPRSSSTTRWLLSRAIRQARDALGAPAPVTARAAVTTCSGGSAIVASCAQVAQRRDGCCRSAVHTCRPQ